MRTVATGEESTVYLFKLRVLSGCENSQSLVADNEIHACVARCAYGARSANDAKSLLF